MPARLALTWITVQALCWGAACAQMPPPGGLPPPGMRPPGMQPHPANTAKPSVTNLSYASASRTQMLDLYLPAPSGAARPLIVFFHGGGFKFGAKEGPLPNLQPYIDAGYAVASVNYRLSGEARFPAAAQDAAAAVRWLRSHAAEFNLDPGRIAAWGQSAGANLAALLGTASRGQFDDAALGNAGVSSRVRAAVVQYAPVDFLRLDKLMDPACAARPGPFGVQKHDAPDSFESAYLGAPIQTVPELAAQANPITHIDADSASFLVQGGGKDCAVGGAQSQLLYEALVARLGKSRAELDMLPEASHADPAFESPQNTQRVLEFLAQRLGK